MSYINLNIATAEALAVKLISENHGADVLAAQRPLEAIDQDDTILVKGTPYRDLAKGQAFCASRVIFSKNDAEILDFGHDARLTLSPQQEQYWRGFMSPEQFDGVFGPRRNYDLEHKGWSMWLFTVANGGLLNSAKLVTAYAAILLQHAWGAPTIDTRQLQATEIDGTWHVEIATAKQVSTVLQISRMTGRVCRLASPPAL